MVKVVFNSSNFEVDKNREQGKARKFISKFIEPGMINYKDIGFGQCLLKKVTIDKFIQTMIGCPVVINHQLVDKSNVKDLAVGYVTNVWFNPEDGWYYCDGILNDEDAESLIEQGFSVSCSFEITEVDKNGGVHNDNFFDTEILNGNFRHLALVENPRFREANIAMNESNKVKKFLGLFNRKPNNEKGSSVMSKTANNESKYDKIKAIMEDESLTNAEKDAKIAELVKGSADNESDKEEDKKAADNKCAKNEDKSDADKKDDADNESDEEDEEEEKKDEKGKSADNSSQSDFDRLKKAATADNSSANSQSLYETTEERCAMGRELY